LHISNILQQEAGIAMLICVFFFAILSDFYKLKTPDQPPAAQCNFFTANIPLPADSVVGG